MLNMLKLITAVGWYKRISLFLGNIHYLICILLSDSSEKERETARESVWEREKESDCCVHLYLSIHLFIDRQAGEITKQMVKAI